MSTENLNYLISWWIPSFCTYSKSYEVFIGAAILDHVSLDFNSHGNKAYSVCVQDSYLGEKKKETFREAISIQTKRNKIHIRLIYTFSTFRFFWYVTHDTPLFCFTSNQITGLLSLLQSEDWIIGYLTSADIYIENITRWREDMPREHKIHMFELTCNILFII